ncbi:hypothetical protein [Allocoleopsis sp.]|uniref:hypothetical protein n=1 Tax=Allocoleopsis sp. TaxID=3088169 RepID=UPI002FD5DB0D
MFFSGFAIAFLFSSPLFFSPIFKKGWGNLTSQLNRIIIQGCFPCTLKPACVGFPGTIEFFAAAGVDGELVVFNFQQVVLDLMWFSSVSSPS